MDSEHSSLLNWPYFFQGKSIEELTQSLLVTTLELETTRLRAQEELKMRDDQLTQLKDMLNQAITERNEAHDNLQKLFLEKILLQQQYLQTAPHSGVSSIDDDQKLRGLNSNNAGFSLSDCEESIVSSPIMDPITPLPKDEDFFLLPDKPLPENGKFLQAVMQAGPLLQTLLLAGPLPQWRHPPPPLDTNQIPPPPMTLPLPPPPPPLPQHPHQESFLNGGGFSNNNIVSNNNINNCGRVNRKRGFCGGYDSSTDAKYQRVVLN